MCNQKHESNFNMQLFYNPTINSETKTFFFDKEESKHIVKVLRKKSGDDLLVTNGLGQIFKTKIAVASENKCVVDIESIEVQNPMPYLLHLAVAPTKMNDRFEWFLEKATEIGISEITPIICDRSERKFIKTDRFEKILISAMKQSAQAYLPKINEAVDLKVFLKQNFKGKKFIAHCEDNEKKLFKDQISPLDNVLVMIGPEGDFSKKEIEMAFAEGFLPTSLGKTRLRTETAAIVACHTITLINQ
jgi:16S rRNA (uracil1498-N3)-methyltransferase